MISISVQSEIVGEIAAIADELLSMAGVNYELMPIAKMTAPEKWREKPIHQWPVKEHIFSSFVLLFGVIPIDVHRFGLTKVGLQDLDEMSSSIVMKNWHHMRTIQSVGEKIRVRDFVEFSARISALEVVLQPIYQFVFTHRHKRLKNKYGVKK